MDRFVRSCLLALTVGLAAPAALMAQGRESVKVNACSLLTREEVKRHLPWIAALDAMPHEEEPVGASGSSCNYPSVTIQVLPSSIRLWEMARQKDGVEAVGGVGDEAYFYNNSDEYAELYVKAGDHVLTVQANVNDTIEAVKPGALSLAKALVAKLP